MGRKQQEGTDIRTHDLSVRNRNTILSVLLVVVCMVALSYASVPLYNLFCRVTGFGGTTQISQALPTQALDREIIVRFDTNVAKNLQWTFTPEIREMKLKIGEKGIANFIATNNDATANAGTALFNVTPLKAGKYFSKIQCFCFGEQHLKPEETVNMPVLFYVDPAMDQDVAMDDVSVITLSYSFFKVDSPELEKAMDSFYESQ